MNLSLSIGKRHLKLQLGKTATAPAPVHETRVPTGRNVGKRMYKSAQTSRLTSDWQISITSADAEILTSAIATRSRMRQMERDDDYFRGMLWLLENNIVGDRGIRLKMECRLSDGSLDETLNKAVETAWQQAMEEESCTVSRDQNGIEVQRLSVRALARDGVILHRKYRGFENPFGFAIEPIEVDRLDHWWNRPAFGTANEIKFGIERDKFKAKVAYWILTRHPGDVFAYSVTPRYREQVMADEVISIWTIERAGQSIGMPLWPSVANRLHNLWGYEESEQIAARVAANKAGFFEVDPKAAGQDEYVGEEDQEGNKISDLQPGQWEQLPVGWKANMIDPKHPTEAFAHFLKAQLRGASAGSGIPYNSVAQDLESVNYSSYKAGMNDARDGFKYLQFLTVMKLMRPWFRSWLPMAVMSGKIPGTTMSDVARISLCDTWKGRRWAGLEPLKETQAQVLAIEAGLDSRRNVIIEDYDRTIEEVFDDQKHDNDLADKYELDFTQGATKPVINSAPVDKEPDTDTGDDTPPKNNGSNGNSRNGHSNGNGHMTHLFQELREQRHGFLGLFKRNPQTPNEENKRRRRSMKFARDENGNLEVDVIERPID